MDSLKISMKTMNSFLKSIQVSIEKKVKISS